MILPLHAKLLTLLLLAFVSLVVITPRSMAQVSLDSVTKEDKPFHSTFTFAPALGLTLQSATEGEQDVLSAQWLASLESKLFRDGEPFQFGAQIYAKYGQSNSENQEPKKTQDDLILSVTPSYTILPVAGIRLFLEITGETQIRPGFADSTPTNFLDPLFLYQMAFLGKRFAHQSEDGTESFDLTAGVGYALQQTVAQQFLLRSNRNVVVTETNPLSQSNITLESGYSAIVDLNYSDDLSNGFAFQTGFKTVALTKSRFTDDIKNARVTSLFTLGLSYKLLSLDYSNHVVYDRNVSYRRNLEQSLVFGVKLKL